MYSESKLLRNSMLANVLKIVQSDSSILISVLSFSPLEEGREK